MDNILYKKQKSIFNPDETNAVLSEPVVINNSPYQQQNNKFYTNNPTIYLNDTIISKIIYYIDIIQKLTKPFLSQKNYQNFYIDIENVKYNFRNLLANNIKTPEEIFNALTNIQQPFITSINKTINSLQNINITLNNDLGECDFIGLINYKDIEYINKLIDIYLNDINNFKQWYVNNVLFNCKKTSKTTNYIIKWNKMMDTLKLPLPTEKLENFNEGCDIKLYIIVIIILTIVIVMIK